MNAFTLTILSALILSIDQVLVKLLINSYELSKLKDFLKIDIILFIFLIGIIGFIGAGAWFFALQKADLTKIYWVTSLSLLFVPCFSLLILKESFTINQFFGYLLITLGAIFVSTK